MRKGLFISNFNPVTLKDIELANAYLIDNNLDELCFYVKHKSNDKVNMLKLVIKDNSKFKIVSEKFKTKYLLVNEKSKVINKEILMGNFNYLDNRVIEYIYKNELYFKDILKNNLSKHRYKHSLSVKKTAIKIAKANNVSVFEAAYAGLLHDICKHRDKEYIYDIVKKYYKQYSNDPYPLLHSYVGAYYVKNYLKLDNDNIIEAIENHAICRSNSKLSKILYIADKIEPLRGYDASEEFELSLYDLDKAFDLVLKKQREFLGDKNG